MKNSYGMLKKDRNIVISISNTENTNNCVLYRIYKRKDGKQKKTIIYSFTTINNCFSKLIILQKRKKTGFDKCRIGYFIENYTVFFP